MSKYLAIHGMLEEMVKMKLDKIKLQRALCAKDLSAEQREQVRTFFASAKQSDDGMDVLVEGDKNVCRVLHPFVKEDEWQITLVAGETIFVKEKLPTGWWLVTKVDTQRKKVMKGKENTGIVPGMCCEWSSLRKHGSNEEVIL